MPDTVRDLIAALPADPWRNQVPFSGDVLEATAKLFAATDTKGREEALGAWLVDYQPCLFGRIAARLGMMDYCILTPADLEADDKTIRATIQEKRLEWHQAGWEGRKSGFVILALSEAIANAVPGERTRRLAQRLCSLYLNIDDIETAAIYWDDLQLEFPGPKRPARQWRVGVNYFCAQGDKRWWHDHRIPGGMAFSMNSVGHLVHSRALADAMLELEARLGLPIGDWKKSKLDSLYAALVFAMRTIDGAANAVSGRATELLPAASDPSNLPRCPVDPLPKDLAGKNHCEYAGWYHTDETLPNEYFLPDVLRPASVTRKELDFTYLFDDSISNLDFFTMGVGVPIRDVDGSTDSPLSDKSFKAAKSAGRELSAAEIERMIARLYGH
jgi:hypothetical protein